MGRLGRFAAMLLWFVLAAVTGGVTLWFGYWLSDVVYEAGLWPLGALMRVVLLFSLLGYGVGMLWLGAMTLMSPFVKGD